MANSRVLCSFPNVPLRDPGVVVVVGGGRAEGRLASQSHRALQQQKAERGMLRAF